MEVLEDEVKIERKNLSLSKNLQIQHQLHIACQRAMLNQCFPNCVPGFF